MKKATAGRERSLSLKTRLRLLFIACSILPLLITWAVSGYQFYHLRRNNTNVILQNELSQMMDSMRCMSQQLINELFESIGAYSRGYHWITRRKGKSAHCFIRAILLTIDGIGAFWTSLLFVLIPIPLLPSARIFDLSHYARIYSDFISLGGFLNMYVHKLSGSLPWIVGLSLGMTHLFWAGPAVGKIWLKKYNKPD